MKEPFLSIRAEMLRQDLLKAEGRFAHHCGDAELSNPERLAVLAEEFGEVARAILEQGKLANDVTGADLREELVQVAAVAAKWIEGIDLRAAASLPKAADPSPPLAQESPAPSAASEEGSR